MRIAVCAAGGGIGQSIIKSLRMGGYRTVAIDPKSDAAGLYMADTGRIGRDCNDPGYIDTLIRICKEEKCRFIFPGLDSELMPMSQNIYKFRDNGIIPVVGQPSLIEKSDDKWKLYQFLKHNNFPYINTADSLADAKEKGIKYPVVLKPMVGGCRSKNVRICNNESEVIEYLSDKKDKYIIQDFIDADEYTCGSVTFDSEVLGVIIMKRTLRDGDTYKAYVESNSYIRDFLYGLLPKLNPFGPCNVQLRLKNNTPYILEINARCSGTTAARALAGFNEPVLACNYLLGRRTDYKIKEIAILRYWNELVVEYKTKKEIENEGAVYRTKWFNR